MFTREQWVVVLLMIYLENGEIYKVHMEATTVFLFFKANVTFKKLFYEKINSLEP